MTSALGTIIGQVKVDITQATAAYVAVRAQHAATVSAFATSGTAFNRSGAAMVATGLLLVAAFGKAVSAAADFEKRLDFFGAVSASTADQMEAVRAKALQLGQDTKYSANQIADSFVELGKAGISAEQIIGGVGEAVANLGAAADIPLVDAANIITSAVQSFDLSARDAVHVANLLAGAANASIVEVQDLGVTLKYVGGVAHQAGIPIESVVDAVSLLGKAGIRGSTAGTSLRQILVSLQGTSKKATAQLKELGIITKDGTNLFIDQTGKIKPLDQVFQILQDHTKGLTQAQQLMAFKTIFNNRALASAAILTKAGAAGFAEMNGEISKTTVAEVAAKRMDNLSGDVEILKGNIETLLIKSGSPFQNFLRGIVQGITKVVAIFSSLPSGVQTGILSFIAITGVILTMMGAFNLIIGTGFRFAEFIVRLGPAFKLLKAGITTVITAMRALSVAFLTNPVGIIIIAIIALVAAFVILYKKSETFRNFINSLGPFFKKVWNGIVTFFQGIPGFFQAAWDKITGAFTTAIDWIKANWKNIIFIIMGPLGILIGNVGGFRDKLVNFFVNLWNTVKNATITGVTAVINFIATLPERVAYWIGFMVGRAIRLWLDFNTFLIKTTIQIVEGVVSFFQQLPGRVAAFVTDMVNRVTTFFTNLSISVATKSAAIYNSVVQWFQLLPGRVATFVTNMVTRAVTLFQNFVARAKSLASQVYNGVVSFIQQLPGRIATFFTQTRDKAVALLSNMLARAKTLATQIRDGVINSIRNLPALLGGVFQRMLDTLSGFVGRAYSRAKSIGGNLWAGFKDGLGIHSPSYIEKAMFKIVDTMDTETKNTIKAVKQIQATGRSLAEDNPVSAYGAALKAGLPASLTPALKRTVSASAAPAIAANLPIPRQRTESPAGFPGGPSLGGGTPLIGTQIVNNPVSEPGSQSAARQARRAALLGGTR